MDKLEADQPQSFRIKRKGTVRYVLVGALAAITIVTLGIYYGFASNERLPSFHLKTIEGDEVVGRTVQLDGRYVGRWGNRDMRVGVEGTDYSFEKRLGMWISLPTFGNYSPKSQALIKEHRGFMRGKTGGTIDQSKDWLTIVDIYRQKDEARLKLSVLNKSTNKSAAYTIDAGPWKDRENIYPGDVQIGGDNIYILLEHMTVNRAGVARYLKFTAFAFDLKTGKLNASRDIPLPDLTGLSVSTLGDRGDQTEAPNVVFITSKDLSESAGNSADSGPKATASSEPRRFEYKAYLYRYADGNLLPINIPDPAKFGRVGTYLDGNMAYTIHLAGESDSWSSEAYRIEGLDLSKQKLKMTYSLKASDLGGELMGSPRFKNGLLYFIVTGEQKPGSMGRPYTKVAAIEAATGKVAYLGQVEYDGPSEKAADELDQSVLINLNLRS